MFCVHDCMHERAQAVSADKIAEMQANIAKVWQRYRYNGLTMMRASSRSILEGNKMNHHGGMMPLTPGVQFANTDEDDAFATIVQWLHSRIPDTR